MVLGGKVVGVGAPGEPQHQALFQDGVEALVTVQNGSKHEL